MPAACAAVSALSCSCTRGGPGGLGRDEDEGIDAGVRALQPRALGSSRTLQRFGGDVARAADNHTAIIEFLVDDVDAEYRKLDPMAPSGKGLTDVDRARHRRDSAPGDESAHLFRSAARRRRLVLRRTPRLWTPASNVVPRMGAASRPSHIQPRCLNQRSGTRALTMISPTANG